MALRAGYYGLKNTVKKKLEKLAADTSGMKIIKSFGDGLNLTQAGKLNMTAATASKIGGVKVGSGLSIEEGVLSADGAGFDYSTSEFDTGQKWVDGSSIYGKTFIHASAYASGDTVDDFGLDKNFLYAYGSLEVTTSTNHYYTNFPNFATGTEWGILIQDYTTGALKILFSSNASRYTNFKFTVFYTKTEEE